MFGRFTFIKTDEISRDQPGVKYMHSATSLLAVLNLIMHFSRKLSTMRPDEGDIS